jgi:hypothetical protein
MVKLALVFVIGLGLGYSYGYHEAAKGVPSYMQVAMSRFGVFRIQAQQQRREQATDAVTR